MPQLEQPDMRSFEKLLKEGLGITFHVTGYRVTDDAGFVVFEIRPEVLEGDEVDLAKAKICGE